MEKNEKFNLSFEDGTNLLFSGDASWIQGENFKQNCYLSLKDGCIMLETLDEENNYRNTYPIAPMITNGLLKQKYREIPILNYKSLLAR